MRFFFASLTVKISQSVAVWMLLDMPDMLYVPDVFLVFAVAEKDFDKLGQCLRT